MWSACIRASIGRAGRLVPAPSERLAKPSRPTRTDSQPSSAPLPPDAQSV
jgi:hypothetical protein